MAKVKTWAVLWEDGLGAQVTAHNKAGAIKLANRTRLWSGARKSRVKLAQPVIGSCDWK